MTISVIIPAFGPQHLLDACLASLANDGEAHEIIVVDNGTGYPVPDDVVVIRNPTNLGYAVANNQGAELAAGDILCLLNEDTEVPSGWLTPLVAAFDDNEVAIVGPRLVHPDGSVQTTGLELWHGNGSAGGRERKDEHPTEDVDGVTGACMLIRADIYRQMGGLDTRFRQGYEDVALCLAVREAGWRIRYVDTVTIVHHEGGSGSARWLHAQANVDLMTSLWGDR